jgi:hypothetical protein
MFVGVSWDKWGAIGRGVEEEASTDIGGVHACSSFHMAGVRMRQEKKKWRGLRCLGCVQVVACVRDLWLSLRLCR